MLTFIKKDVLGNKLYNFYLIDGTDIEVMIVIVKKDVQFNVHNFTSLEQHLRSEIRHFVKDNTEALIEQYSQDVQKNINKQKALIKKMNHQVFSTYINENSFFKASSSYDNSIHVSTDKVLSLALFKKIAKLDKNNKYVSLKKGFYLTCDDYAKFYDIMLMAKTENTDTNKANLDYRMSKKSLETWKDNADMPTQDKDGKWFDLETGIYFNE